MTRILTEQTGSLSSLAEQINHEHQQAEDSAKKAISHALAAGRLLVEAKSQVKHGEWLPWLKANCDVSDRQAQRYMKLADNWQAIESKNDTGSDLTVTSDWRLLGPWFGTRRRHRTQITL